MITKNFPLFLCLLLLVTACQEKRLKIFDVHLHGSENPSNQVETLKQSGVYKVAISTSWELQKTYSTDSAIEFLSELMFPCPNGKVPYSLQPCYDNGLEWPEVSWVEEQIQEGRIQFFGEVLSQYYGIEASDSLLYPYYSLAQKYNLPIGIHTGGAGPNHGSPNFKMEFGNPIYLTKMLTDFPGIRVWIMHSGDQFYLETIKIMQTYQHVYTDISVISNPDIVPLEKFETIITAFINAGLEDRLMFATDNGNIDAIIKNIESLKLSADQKDKIYFQNAERFFSR